MDWDDLVRSRRPQWTEKSPCESNNIETPIRHGELSKLTQETCSATSFRARLFGRDAQNQDKSEDLRSNGRCFPSAYRVHPYSRPVHLEPNRTQARRQRLHGLPTLNFTPVEPVPRTVTYLHRTQPSSVQCSHLPRHSALPWESVNSQWVPELETTSATETQPWDSRREAMVAPSEKLKPCRLDKSQEQLLERIKGTTPGRVLDPRQLIVTTPMVRFETDVDVISKLHMPRRANTCIQKSSTCSMMLMRLSPRGCLLWCRRTGEHWRGCEI